MLSCEILHQSLAQRFVLRSHIQPKDVHDGEFEEEVYPRVEGEQGEVEHDGACVERQDVCPFH